MIRPVPSGTNNGTRCPVCGRPSVAATRPFCSERCADVDLGRWLTGQYRIPAGPDTDDEAGGVSDGAEGAT